MRQKIPAQTSDFKRFRQHAHIVCQVCRWRVIWPWECVNDRFRPSVSVAKAQKRLRCHRCGAKAALMQGLQMPEYHG